MPAPRARLKRGEPVAPQPFRPIGHHHRMRRSGHRVLVDAISGGEDAADDIGRVALRRTARGRIAGRRHDDDRLPRRLHRALVGIERADGRGIGDDDQRIAFLMPQRRLDRIERQRLDIGRQVGGVRPPRGQRERIAIVDPRDLEHARLPRREPHPRQRGVRRQHDMPARQRRMPAQRDLGGGGEPAQVEIGVVRRAGHDERGFAEVVLLRDPLEHVVRQPCR